MRKWSLVLMMAALTGCAATTPNLAPITQRTVVPGDRFEQVQGEASLVVRTFTEDAAGARREVAGATCSVGTSLYETKLVTPSGLTVPNFGPQSPDLRFDCRAGDLRGSFIRQVSTTWRYAPGDYGYWPGSPALGIYGATGGRSGVGVGWSYGGGWGAPAYPKSGYRDVNILLR